MLNTALNIHDAILCQLAFSHRILKFSMPHSKHPKYFCTTSLALYCLCSHTFPALAGRLFLRVILLKKTWNLRSSGIPFLSFENLKGGHGVDSKSFFKYLLFRHAILAQFGTLTLELMESPLEKLLSYPELTKLVPTTPFRIPIANGLC